MNCTIQVFPVVRRMVWLVSLSLRFESAAAADLLVELDSPVVKAGEAITIHLVGLNSFSAVATKKFPETVHATLVAGPAREEITFNSVDSLPAAGVTIAPNSFARLAYRAAVSPRLHGHARLEMNIEGSIAFALEITGASSTANAATALGSGNFSMQEAMDRETPETSFFKRHVFPYEPFYFIAGPDAPAAKFQVSVKYRLVNTETGDDGKAEGWLYRRAKWTEGLHLAYTQRSLWDLAAESAPFLDSSYMPELLYELPHLIDPEQGWIKRIGAQVGIQHESNGKDGAASRSLNIGYLRMPFVLGNEDDFYVMLEPRAWFYVGDLSDNPDLADYRGYVDLRLKAGWARGVQVTGWLRSGKEFDRGSAQVDVTYPLHNLLARGFSVYLQAQYFNGYGESLLYYNQHSEIWRVGIGLFR